MAFLRIFMEREGAQEFRLGEARMVLGRSVKEADVVIPDPKVSRIHATIHCREGHYIIRDENSSLGTHVNGERVEKALLSAGDTIQIGGCMLEFHDADEAGSGAESADAAGAATDPHVRKCLEHFHLLPDALQMRYRVVHVSPDRFFSPGDTLQLSGKGILLPTYSPLRESTMIEMRFSTPDKKQSTVLGEVYAVIPYKNMQTLCLKLHRHSGKEFEALIQTSQRGFWVDAWPLGAANTLADLSSLR